MCMPPAVCCSCYMRVASCLCLCSVYAEVAAAEALQTDAHDIDRPAFVHDGRIAFVDFVVNTAAVDQIAASDQPEQLHEVARKRTSAGDEKRADAHAAS
jgi:hypothetical protein